MAGEWIKVDSSTPDKPEVLRISRLLSIDAAHAFGCLLRVWCWFDRNSVGGSVDGVVSTDVDAIARKDGFAHAMREVGWLKFDDEKQRVGLPHFDRHNGETAKKRILRNERQSRWRSKTPSTSSSTNPTTREEKRRSKTPISPFALPKWVPENEWAAFEETRKRLRKPMTDRAKELVILELAKLRDAGHDPAAVLQQSVRKSWLDVFPIKGGVVSEEKRMVI